MTAALLQQRGYQVTGVYMKSWTQHLPGFTCPWHQDLVDAQSVAAKLAIPFAVFDFQTAYKQKVVDYMIKEYQAGFTPNPDIMCNQEIKFKLFLDTALEDGADLIATGHYARLQGRYLQRGLDQAKDQSYFLYRIGTKAIEKSLMPLGELKKAEVRMLAKKFNLPTADKPDSQGICFVGEVGIKEFLSHYIKTNPGPIKTVDGVTLGQHEGAAFYTIGQRHGLKVGGGLPYYVVGKDMKTNTVVVTNNLADETLTRDNFLITKPHWIGEIPDPRATYEIRSRYRGQLIRGKVRKVKNRLQIKLEQAERAITPGQSAVIYDGETVLGGGIITLD